jgi:hypothetical protein
VLPLPAVGGTLQIHRVGLGLVEPVGVACWARSRALALRSGRRHPCGRASWQGTQVLQGPLLPATRHRTLTQGMLAGGYRGVEAAAVDQGDAGGPGA